MRVLILTLGSRGDIEPFVALAKGLAARGHVPSLCAPASFAASIRAHAVDNRDMDDGFVALARSLEGQAAFEDMGQLYGALKTVIRLMPKADALQDLLLNDAWQAAESVRPDVIVFHAKLPGALDIAEALDVPAVMAPLFPQFVPTSAFPTLGFPDLPLGPGYRRATYRVMHAIAARIGMGPVRRLRSNLGLGARPEGMGPMTDHRGRAVPVLHGFSPLLCPRPADWPDSARVTGHWPLAASGAGLATLLRDFLDDGTPPVYVGFGSMAGRDPERAASEVVAALRQVRCRGILAGGWGGLAPVEPAGDLLFIESAPHDALFPHVAAVVHHGGAGTTHAGLRAGRPSLLCPFFGDQPFWGRRVEALGVGPAAIPQRSLNAPRLAHALQLLVADAGMRQRAATLGEALAQENGVATAVSMLERVAR